MAEAAAGAEGFGKNRFTNKTGNLEIFVGPLLEKVFFNRFENTIRHGGPVIEIQVSSIVSCDDGIITFEDNSIGVPALDKKKIFKRGWANTPILTVSWYGRSSR